MQRVKQIGGWVWYPWLFGFFPTLYLYGRNVEKVYASELFEIFGVVIVVVGLLMGLLWLVARDIHKAGAMTGTVVVAFFLYGPIIMPLLQGKTPQFEWATPYIFPGLIVLSIVLILLFAFVVPARALQKATPSITIIAAGLVAYNAAISISEVMKQQALIQSLRSLVKPTAASKITNDAAHPDVYFIILDSYPSNASLQRTDGIDNSDFTAALEKRGFFVAYDSTSNYPTTLPSMASTLNMSYITPDQKPDNDTTGVTTMRMMIANNPVALELQARGYTYVFVSSGFDTSSNMADLSIDFFPDGQHAYHRGSPEETHPYASESLWFSVLDTTMLRSYPDLWSFVITRPDRPLLWNSPERVLESFDVPAQIADMPEATFSLVHINKPHVPIDLTADGKIIPPNTRIGKTRKAYREQLTFINNRTLQMIDDIFAKSSVPPIIIIQGDHGSHYGNHGFNGNAMYFHILNALYLPNGGAKNLPQDIMSVNTFRVLFNTYFQTHLDLLEPHHYALPQGYVRIFNMEETQP